MITATTALSIEGLAATTALDIHLQDRGSDGQGDRRSKAL
jgi:hypothetical protein